MWYNYITINVDQSDALIKVKSAWYKVDGTMVQCVPWYNYTICTMVQWYNIYHGILVQYVQWYIVNIPWYIQNLSWYCYRNIFNNEINLEKLCVHFKLILFP